MKKVIRALVAASFLSACGGAQEGSSFSVTGASPPDYEEADGGILDEGDGGASPDGGEPGREESGLEEGVALTMDVIDVGTGLSILVRGADFALLYDAGSKEDIGRNKRNRVLEFMRERHPDLERLDHVVLSHPHRDHVNLLDEVLERYEVGNIWDVGLLHPVCPYLRFLRAVSEEKGASYRSAARGPGPLRLGFDESPCERDEALPENRYLVVHGPKLKTGEKVRLGRDVVMTFLHVDPRDKKDPNENSLVVRIDAAGKRILLMGDAKAGERVHPRYKPDKDSTEGRLLRDSPGKIKADVMVVGHHGSHTSSRTAFLDAVGAKTFIVSVGMAALDGYALPNPDVIEALEKRGRVLRTDARDRKCLKSRRKVGKGDDGMVGGCDNIRVVVFEDEKREPDFEIYPRRL